MYENFGAIVNQQQVEFRLFLPDNTVDRYQYRRGGKPNIKEIRVVGDFQGKIGGKNWDINSAPIMSKNPHPKGWLYTYQIDGSQNLPDGFYQYKYFVTFENGTTRWVSDPCTKYGGTGNNENAAFVIGGPVATVRPIANRLPLQDLVVYEMMIDNCTAEFRGKTAPVDAVSYQLDYLQELGINAIEFMPWTAWPGGKFNWGYEPFLFFSVENRYIEAPGDPTNKIYRLKALINDLHRRNIHVIMDGVFNHVKAGSNPNQGFPYKWLYQDPDDSPYLGSFAGGGFFEDFDYNNQCVQEFISDVCLYWLNTYQIDGIRFDYTLGFYRQGNPNAGITKLIHDLKGEMQRQGKQNVAFIIEHLTDNRFDAINDTNKIGASGCWFDPFMYKSVEYSRNGNIDREILRILNANLDYASDKGPITYIENHDHSTIVHQVGGRNRWFKTQPSAIALLTSPGAVMIHNGQEYGEDYYLPHYGGKRVKSRPLHWDQFSNDFIGQRLYQLYQKLIKIRAEHPALRSENFFPDLVNHPDGYGAFPDKDVVIYHRFGQGNNNHVERFIIVLNYSDFDQFVDIPFSGNGQWKDLLNEDSVVVRDFRLHNQRINSNWGRIYYQSRVN